MNKQERKEIAVLVDTFGYSQKEAEYIVCNQHKDRYEPRKVKQSKFLGTIRGLIKR